jgi:hypothetical protein
MSCPSAFIVSQGGCGSTVFFDQLGYGSRCENVKNCTCVKKHVLANCLKNVTFIKNTKILYIYGNPYEQLLSVARRCFIPHLIYEYENSDYSKYVDTFKKSVFLKWHEFVNPGTNERQCVGVGLEEILSRYLEDRNAFVDFRLHYMSWKKVPLKNVSIRFLKYDEILNSGKEKICSWFDRDFDFKLKKRKVNYVDFKKNHPEISEKIEEKYKSWFSLYQKIPLVEDLIW